MKMLIKWHETNLVNKIIFAKRLQNEINNKQKRLDNFIKDNIFLAHQIEQAKKQKKDGFDDDRFLAKQRPKEL